jgi:hypothetical protein
LIVAPINQLFLSRVFRKLHQVIVKPSEVAPLTGGMVVKALMSVLPVGVVAVAQGDGDVGASLVSGAVDMASEESRQMFRMSTRAIFSLTQANNLAGGDDRLHRSRTKSHGEMCRRSQAPCS